MSKSRPMIKKLLFFFAITLCCFETQAQVVSLTLNLGSENLSSDNLEVDQTAEDNGAVIDYLNSNSKSLNFRYYTRTKWAFRLGAEIDEIDYQFGSLVDSFQEATRTDIVALFGFEKHFVLGGWIDIYPGVVFPVTFTGDETTSGDAFSQLSVQDIFASPGVVLGTNVKLLKVLRLGLEADMTYDNFKADIIGAESFNDIKVSDLDFNLYATIGVAF